MTVSRQGSSIGGLPVRGNKMGNTLRSLWGVGISTLIVGALMTAMFFYGESTVSHLSGQIDRIVDRDLGGSIELSDVNTSVQSINSHFNRLLLQKSIGAAKPDFKSEIDAIGQDLDGAIAKLEAYREHYATPEQQSRILEVLGYLSDYRGATTWIGNMAEIDFQSATNFIEPFGIVFDRAQRVLRDIVEQAKRDAQSRSAAASQRASNAVSTFLYVSVAVALGVALVSWIIGRYQQRLKVDSDALREQVADRTKDLTAAFERQTASVEILAAISSAGTDPEPVFRAVLKNATRLCNCESGGIWRVSGEDLFHVARQTHDGFRMLDGLQRMGPESSFNRFIRQQVEPWQSADIRESDVSGFRSGDSTAVEAVNRFGVRTALWVPLMKDGAATGYIVVFRTHVELFSPAQIDMLKEFAAQAVIAIENIRALLALKDRTEELAANNNTLRNTQAQLVQAEKMASLGTLVAGVAHEINTPLGIAITATSHLISERDQLEAAASAKTLGRANLSAFLDQSKQGLSMVATNLTRAANLVGSFKQVAVDQNIEDARQIDLGSYVGDVVRSVAPLARSKGIKVINEIPAGIMVTLAPGALAQILTNLIQNAALHAFDGISNPQVTIAAEHEDASITLRVADNGIGMTHEIQAKAFDPFFTTKRGEGGGTGLGLHIVHNLVTEALRGTVVLTSSPGNGTEFAISLGRMATAS